MSPSMIGTSRILVAATSVIGSDSNSGSAPVGLSSDGRAPNQSRARGGSLQRAAPPPRPDSEQLQRYAADTMVALFVLGVIGIVMALGIKQVETRLLCWRPEYQKR